MPILRHEPGLSLIQYLVDVSRIRLPIDIDTRGRDPSAGGLYGFIGRWVAGFEALGD